MLLSLLTTTLLAAPVQYCAVDGLIDYQLGLTRLVSIRLDPACLPGGIARVQAVSASRSRCFPKRGAWTLTTLNPFRGEWLSPFWKLEYWDGSAWVPARVR
ncbi:hypothetical protein DES52_116124 [Deinococcus yavapaiensis KR-236]|uniref:Uncharacterized protein n=1 Tax=Deinococcus yavapaiensis KR-236 TaxID=694435 RepID=A0A318S3M9_9DEIO|nr:hypothetical protein DES52_116124 [Deinococcus yavapaiensis KR-236]